MLLHRRPRRPILGLRPDLDVSWPDD